VKIEEKKNFNSVSMYTKFFLYRMIILFCSVEMSQHEINLPSLQASYMWTDNGALQASYMWTDGGDPQKQSYIKDKGTTVRR
jgi:hypothetical protein